MRKRIVRHCHAAPSVELPICVAVAVCELRIFHERHATVTQLPFLYFAAVAALWFAPDSLRKGVIHKRVETLVSTLLCPCRVGKISFASQALNHRLAETNKQY